MPQVARVVIRDGRLDRVPGGPRSPGGQVLGDGGDLGRERLRPFGQGAVVGEGFAVLLEGRSTAGRVGNDRVAVVDVNAADQLARELAAFLLAARVQAQCAAAPL